MAVRSTGVLLSLALMALGAGCRTDDEPEGAAAELVGGAQRDDESIVYLSMVDFDAGVGFACSGTVIGSHAVLTAKHCIEQLDPAAVSIFVTGDAELPGDPIPVSAIHALPGRQNPLSNEWIVTDLAVLYTAAPFPVPPKPVSFDVPQAGDAIELAGLGIYDVEADLAGVERHGSGRIVATVGSMIVVVGDDSSICNGDSGGPVLDAAGRVIGVNSAAASCDRGAWGYTVSVGALELMVRRAIGYAPGCAAEEICGNAIDDDCSGAIDDTCGAEGRTCAQDWQCVSGMCSGGRCVARCLSDADCEEGVCLGSCRTIGARCGDGVIDEGEACDSGAFNGTALSACSYDCTTDGPRCGDGKIAPGRESCDDGALNGQPFFCPLGCRAPPGCGDGVQDAVDGCTDLALTASECASSDCDGQDAECILACVERRCAVEICDSGAEAGEYGYCNTLCSGAAAACGDGRLDPGEVCDDGRDAGYPGHCDFWCTERLPPVDPAGDDDDDDDAPSDHGHGDDDDDDDGPPGNGDDDDDDNVGTPPEPPPDGGTEPPPPPPPPSMDEDDWQTRVHDDRHEAPPYAWPWAPPTVIPPPGDMPVLTIPPPRRVDYADRIEVDESGCSCSTGPGTSPFRGAWLGLGVLALVFRRRRTPR